MCHPDRQRGIVVAVTTRSISASNSRRSEREYSLPLKHAYTRLIERTA